LAPAFGKDGVLRREYLYFHHNNNRAVRVGDMKLVAAGKTGPWELYDLRKDPFQLKNVAADPAYAATLKQIDTQLMAALKDTKDPRATGGGDEFDRYPTMTATQRGGGGKKKGKKK
ncbi:MAG: DUF4976 domain-containing protein, partial [Bryobacterales bacterium]|nr:DUF4976 domain-containing protein [Bryobacterales bacterium]